MFDLAKSSDGTFVRVVAALFVALQALPFAVLLLLRPDGTIYTGALFSPVDYYAYAGHMLHAQQGAVRFVDYWTYQPMSRPPIYLFYAIVGHLQLPLPAPVAVAVSLHVLRLVLAGLLAWQLWRLYGELLPGRDVRRVALLLALFTSGLGVFAQLVPGVARGLSYDLASPQSSTFFNVEQPPHDAFVLLMLAVILRILQAVLARGDRRPRVVATGALATLMLSLVHPDKMVVLAIAVSVFSFVAVRRLPAVRAALPARLATVALILLPGLPYAAYAAWLSRTDPVVHLAATQGTPPPLGGAIDLLVGYGLPLVFAVVGIAWLLRRRDPAPGPVLLLGFVIGGLCLLPFSFGYHAAAGSQFGIAALAALGLMRAVLPRLWARPRVRQADRHHFLGYDRSRLRVLSLNMVIIVCSPTVMALAFAAPRAVLASAASEVYIPPDDARALVWVQDHVPHDDVVLGSPVSGEWLVAYGGSHVVYGDPSFTPDYDSEGTRLGRFFNSPTISRQYLEERHVKWLYFGPREAAARFDPAASPAMTVVFRTGSTTIYRVDPARVAP